MCRERAGWASSRSLGARGGARRALEAAHRSVDLLRAGARKGARDMAEAVAARAANLGHALAVKLVAEARRLRIDRRRGLPALAARGVNVELGVGVGSVGAVGSGQES